MSGIPYVCLIITGSKQFPRFVIQVDENFWTGQHIGGESEEALVFSDPAEARSEVHRLLQILHEDRPVRRFEAKVEILLYTDEQVDLHELKHWLHKVSELTINDHERNGPNGSACLPSIDWHTLKETS